MAKFLSQADFAKRRRVSRKTITVWKQRGWVLSTAAGLVDVERSEALLAARPAKFRGGTIKALRAPSPEQVAAAPDWSLAESTRRRQAAMAQLAELDLAKAGGKLIEVDQVRELWARIVIATRNMFLGLPGKIAFEVPMLTAQDRATIARICRDDLEDAAMGRGLYFGDVVNRGGGAKADDDEPGKASS
jgi:phage terminase Nu1 subunit (DNA packaging protein)